MKHKGTTIFRVMIGSHMYGLSTPQSDTDYLSVFLPPVESLLGLHPYDTQNNSTRKEEVWGQRNGPEDVDDKAYSLRRFLQLLIQNNPNILEILYAPKECIIESSPLMSTLIKNRDKIVSARCGAKFNGYAYAQKHKAVEKAERYYQLSKLMDLLERKEYHHMKGVARNQIEDEEFKEFLYEVGLIVPYIINQHGERIFVEDSPNYDYVYKNTKRDFEAYGSRIVNNEIVAKCGYEPKAAYHLIRLMHEYFLLVSQGKIIFPLDGAVRDTIMKVKRGEVSVEELMFIYDRYRARIEELEPLSPLRVKPDEKWLDNFLIEAHLQHIQNS